MIHVYMYLLIATHILRVSVLITMFPRAGFASERWLSHDNPKTRQNWPAPLYSWKPPLIPDRCCLDANIHRCHAGNSYCALDPSRP